MENKYSCSQHPTRIEDLGYYLRTIPHTQMWDHGSGNILGVSWEYPGSDWC